MMYKIEALNGNNWEPSGLHSFGYIENGNQLKRLIENHMEASGSKTVRITITTSDVLL